MNLDRLKETGLLIDGLDEFLRRLGLREQKSEFLISDPDLFSRLPYELKRFYEIYQNWPQLKTCDPDDYCLEKGPTLYDHSQYDSYFDEDDEDYLEVAEQIEGIYDDFVIIGSFQDNCEIFAFDGPLKGSILFPANSHKDLLASGWAIPMPEAYAEVYQEWNRTNQTLEECLVDKVLYAVCSLFKGRAHHLDINFTPANKESDKLFSGLNFDYFYYQTDNLLACSGGFFCRPEIFINKF